MTVDHIRVVVLVNGGRRVHGPPDPVRDICECLTIVVGQVHFAAVLCGMAAGLGQGNDHTALLPSPVHNQHAVAVIQRCLKNAAQASHATVNAVVVILIHYSAVPEKNSTAKSCQCCGCHSVVPKKHSTGKSCQCCSCHSLFSGA